MAKTLWTKVVLEKDGDQLTKWADVLPTNRGYIVTLRHYPVLDKHHRIKWRSKTFKIMHISHKDNTTVRCVPAR